MNRKAVVILGMHRSGTSTASGMFHLSGFDLGRSVTGGNPANPKGFFENYRLLFFHDDLLRHLGTDWHHTAVLQEGWWLQEGIDSYAERLKSLISEDYGRETPLLFKDPRLCILLPLYLRVFDESGIDPVFVLMYRNPGEVIRSLSKRDSFPSGKSARMWMDHMLRAEHYTRGYPRVFLNYSDVLADPVSAMSRVVSEILPGFTLDPSLAERLCDFVEPVLNHFGGEPSETGEEGGLQAALNAVLLKANQGEPSPAGICELDRIRSAFFESYNAGNFPGVTVITPYNGEAQAIGSTVQSVAGQDYPSLTHLIVNRCGSGEPGLFPEGLKYLVSRIVEFPDTTFGEALMAGSDAASGEWLAVMIPGAGFPAGDFLRKRVMKAYHCDAFIEDVESGSGPILIIRRSLAGVVFSDLEVETGLFPKMISRLNACGARVQSNV